MIHNAISFVGIIILLLIAWGFSTNRKRINIRLIGWGIALQFLFALFVFKIPAGNRFFFFLNDVVVKIVDASASGAEFLFGPLALSPGKPGSIGFILAFQALPTIIFFSALISVLYFFKVMPLIIRGFASVFSRSMNISGAESVSVASNIFVGIESVFTIRPHVPTMTRSELCTVLTTGMATVASNVLALYVFTLREQFPMIAGHLVSASLLSAPAAVITSKLLLPEEQIPDTLGKKINPHYERSSNLFEAIINGANEGVKVVVGVAALLVAVLGLVALVDVVLGALGGKINVVTGWHFDWSMKGILGVLFYPFSLIMGVQPEDAVAVAKIVGERTIATEVAGYKDLALAIAEGTIKHPRSIVITTYALCGFAHLASMAIFVGGIAALPPTKKKVLSQIGFRALCAATLACLITACMAGIFFTDNSILLGN